MDTSLYSEFYNLENTHWWFRGRRKVIEAFLKLIPKPINAALDIGCGTGRNVLMLSSYAQRAEGVDVSEEAISFAKKRAPGASISKVSFPDESPTGVYDVVTSFDVLEHIENEALALRRFEELVKPGGYLLITLPAFQLLWSEHDELAYHYRRYTKSTVQRLFRESQFEIVRLTYFNTILFLPVLAFRLVKKALDIRSGASDFFPLPRLLNELLFFVFSLESWTAPRITLPVGVSLICLFRKKSGHA